MCPLPLEPPSHLSPHPTALACLRALGLSWLNHTENSHWLSVLHMVICMFSCYPLNLSHPLLSPWRRPWHPTLVLLPGKSHGRGSLVGCGPWGRKESDRTERLHSHFSLSRIGEGSGSPLQCSCLENPRGGGAWWAAVYGVAQSRTRLKRLSSGSSFPHRVCKSLLNNRVSITALQTDSSGSTF